MNRILLLALLVVVNKGRPPEEIYAWHLRQFKPYGAKPADVGVIVPPEAQVFGAQMCAWEQPEQAELPSLRLRLPAMSERVWNPTVEKALGLLWSRAVGAQAIFES